MVCLLWPLHYSIKRKSRNASVNITQVFLFFMHNFFFLLLTPTEIPALQDNLFAVHGNLVTGIYSSTDFSCFTGTRGALLSGERWKRTVNARPWIRKNHYPDEETGWGDKNKIRRRRGNEMRKKKKEEEFNSIRWSNRLEDLSQNRTRV